MLDLRKDAQKKKCYLRHYNRIELVTPGKSHFHARAGILNAMIGNCGSYY